jgi:hypothetical protein
MWRSSIPGKVTSFRIVSKCSLPPSMLSRLPYVEPPVSLLLDARGGIRDGWWGVWRRQRSD